MKKVIVVLCVSMLLFAVGCVQENCTKWQVLRKGKGYEELQGVQLVKYDGFTHRIYYSARIEETGSGDYLVLITGERPVRFARREEAFTYASNCIDASIAATLETFSKEEAKSSRGNLGADTNGANLSPKPRP